MDRLSNCLLSSYVCHSTISPPNVIIAQAAGLAKCTIACRFATDAAIIDADYLTQSLTGKLRALGSPPASSAAITPLRRASDTASAAMSPTRA